MASTPPLNLREDEFAGHTPLPSFVAIFIPTGFAASNNRPVLAFKSSETSSASASVTTMPRTLISVSSLPDHCISPRNEGAAFVGATRIEHVASDILITVPFRPSIPLSLNSMGCVPRCDARYTNRPLATILLSEAGELNTIDVGVATESRESVPLRIDTTSGEDHSSFITGNSSTPPVTTRGRAFVAPSFTTMGAEPQPRSTGGDAGATSISTDEGGPPSTDAVTRSGPGMRGGS